MIEKLISGGQCGSNQGGLLAASLCGIPTGGFAPLGWHTEEGPQEELMRGYGLVECVRPGYNARTEANVRAADLTIIMGWKTGGSYATYCMCEALNKPLALTSLRNALDMPDWTIEREIEYIIGRIWEFDPKVVNIAGSRESKYPGIGQLVCEVMLEVLTRVNG